MVESNSEDNLQEQQVLDNEVPPPPERIRDTEPAPFAAKGGVRGEYMNNERTIDVVSKFVECINAGDLEGLCSLMTDDFTFIDYRGKVERGKDVMREGFKGYFSDFPDYKIIVKKVLTGGTGVAIIGKTTGSHIPPEVEERETVLWTAEVRDGRVAEWRIYADTDAVNQTVA